jgi:competence protein ComEA
VNRLRELLTKAKAGDKASRIALIAPVVAFVFALGWFNSGVPPTQVIEPTPSLYAEPSSLAEAGNFATTDIFVHVTGAVAKPGVYAAEVGSRVFDIVAMAGGFTKKADQASVNLARLVSDGEQLLVFERASEAKSASTSSNTSVGSMAGTLVSLNRATLSELEELPGVGPTLAQRIIDWRSANGGFKSLEDLLEVGGIGDKLFAGIQGKVAL